MIARRRSVVATRCRAPSLTHDLICFFELAFYPPKDRFPLIWDSGGAGWGEPSARAGGRGGREGRGERDQPPRCSLASSWSFELTDETRVIRSCSYDTNRLEKSSLSIVPRTLPRSGRPMTREEEGTQRGTGLDELAQVW